MLDALEQLTLSFKLRLDGVNIAAQRGQLFVGRHVLQAVLDVLETATQTSKLFVDELCMLFDRLARILAWFAQPLNQRQNYQKG